jgi:hypothetical protein
MAVRFFLSALARPVPSRGSRAETDTVRLAPGGGIGYLPETVMTERGLIEDQAKRAGPGGRSAGTAAFGFWDPCAGSAT